MELASKGREIPIDVETVAEGPATPPAPEPKPATLAMLFRYRDAADSAAIAGACAFAVVQVQ